MPLSEKDLLLVNVAVRYPDKFQIFQQVTFVKKCQHCKVYASFIYEKWNIKVSLGLKESINVSNTNELNNMFSHLEIYLVSNWEAFMKEINWVASLMFGCHIFCAECQTLVGNLVVLIIYKVDVCLMAFQVVVFAECWIHMIIPKPHWWKAFNFYSLPL